LTEPFACCSGLYCFGTLYFNGLRYSPLLIIIIIFLLNCYFYQATLPYGRDSSCQSYPYNIPPHSRVCEAGRGNMTPPLPVQHSLPYGKGSEGGRQKNTQSGLVNRSSVLNRGRVNKGQHLQATTALRCLFTPAGPKPEQQRKTTPGAGGQGSQEIKL